MEHFCPPRLGIRVTRKSTSSSDGNPFLVQRRDRARSASVASLRPPGDAGQFSPPPAPRMLQNRAPRPLPAPPGEGTNSSGAGQAPYSACAEAGQRSTHCPETGKDIPTGVRSPPGVGWTLHLPDGGVPGPFVVAGRGEKSARRTVPYFSVRQNYLLI